MAQAKILLVDDDRLVLATVTGGLKAAGYRIETASAGKEAIELIEANRFDLVILDIRMPDLSGIEVSSKLQAEGIPFIVLSAYGNSDVVTSMVRNGALGYLVKPVDVEQIVPAIEAALNRSEEIFQLRASEKNLQIALDADRNTSKAIGILMERHKLSCEDAFEMLRRSARSQRRKLAEVARELVVAENTLNNAVLPNNQSPVVN